MFFSGSAYQALKRYIPLSGKLFWPAVLALALSVADQRAFFVVYNLTLPYLLFFTAYVPSGAIRSFNRVGDYSYGVYIYAFPVQQSVVALVPRVSTLSLWAVSTVITLLLAAASWHLVEKHFLKLREHCVDRSRRLARLPWPRKTIIRAPEKGSGIDSRAPGSRRRRPLTSKDTSPQPEGVGAAKTSLPRFFSPSRPGRKAAVII